MQRKNESLLSRGIITQSGEICKGKINLVSGAITQPFAEMVWVSTGGDKETINRLTDIFISTNTPADCGKLFKNIKALYGLIEITVCRAYPACEIIVFTGKVCIFRKCNCVSHSI